MRSFRNSNILAKNKEYVDIQKIDLDHISKQKFDFIFYELNKLASPLKEEVFIRLCLDSPEIFN